MSTCESCGEEWASFGLPLQEGEPSLAPLQARWCEECIEPWIEGLDGAVRTGRRALPFISQKRWQSGDQRERKVMVSQPVHYDPPSHDPERHPERCPEDLSDCSYAIR